MKNQIAVMTMLLTLAAPGRAQEQRPAAAASSVASSTLRIQLVLSRFQGEKKVSSLPYTMMVHADDRRQNSGRATLRLGTQVPITTMTRQGNDANAPLVPSVQYRDVGTSIDCIVTAIEDGRYKVEVTLEDSSIDTGTGTGTGTATATGANTTAPHPAFRSFRTNDTVTLRDGQSAQSFTATDKVNGEVWKVDVTLSVVK